MTLLNILLLPTLSLAALLSPQGATHSFEGVNLPSKAELVVESRSYSLTAIGEGLRYKKVLFIKARVYVGQLLASEPDLVKKDKNQILDSLSLVKVVSMQMTFLRNVDAKTLGSAFKESFKENNVPLESEAIEKFLEAVKSGGEAKEGKTITVAGEILNGKEIVSYEGSNGQTVIIEGPLGLRRQIFSLWLGKPADSGVENLQQGLLK